MACLTAFSQWPHVIPVTIKFNIVIWIIPILKSLS
jgi:hypothetical protein